MADELVTVDSFWQVSQAHLAKSALEGVGIQAFLENENTVMMAPHLTNSTGVKLLVKRCDLQQATEVLKLGNRHADPSDPE